MKKVVLITGVSSGFGKEICLLLASKEYIVYGTYRSSCEPVSGATLIQLDVTDNAAIDLAIQQLIQQEGRIDILINNAGMGYGGAIESFTEEEMDLQMRTNFTAIFHTCRAVLPQMRKQGNGTIINFSSIGGLMGLPFQGVYSASKFAIEGFSESLRYEVKPFDIKVIVINPGDFHTQFTAKRKVTTGTSAQAYSEQFKKSLAIIEKDEIGGLNPSFMSRKIWSILQKKRPKTRYIVASLEQKLAVLLKYILPNKLFFQIIGNHYGIK
jgi:NAD(P)-dependent dehydrogenase (short-subunit alcohol dehydrogenase family)